MSARRGPPRELLESLHAPPGTSTSPPGFLGQFVQLQILPYFATLLLVLSATAVQAAQFSVTNLGTGMATAVNNSGQITGFADFVGSNPRAFRYTNGVRQSLIPLSGSGGNTRNLGNAINNSGQVVGNSATIDISIPHAVRYDANTTAGTDLGTLGGLISDAFGINSSGVVVGESRIANSGRTHAFIYSGGTMTDLLPDSVTSSANSINDAGQITGYLQAGPRQAFLFDDGEVTLLGALGDGNLSVGKAINASGQVVGYSTIDTISETLHAFLYSGGVMQDLGTIESYFSQATAINSTGVIVGNLLDPIGQDPVRGFLFEGGFMQDINDLTTTLGWTITQLAGINDSGLIVGRGMFDPDGPGGTAPITRAVLLTPVPEPGALLLSAVGCLSLAGFAAIRRCRRNAESSDAPQKKCPGLA